MSPCFSTSRAALHCSAWLLLSDRCLVKETRCNPLTLYLLRGKAYRAAMGWASWAGLVWEVVKSQAVSLSVIFKLAQLRLSESDIVYSRLTWVGVMSLLKWIKMHSSHFCLFYYVWAFAQCLDSQSLGVYSTTVAVETSCKRKIEKKTWTWPQLRRAWTPIKAAKKCKMSVPSCK